MAAAYWQSKAKVPAFSSTCIAAQNVETSGLGGLLQMASLKSLRCIESPVHCIHTAHAVQAAYTNSNFKPNVRPSASLAVEERQ